MMKLFLLKRLDDVGWDESAGFVIRAADEDAARALVATSRESTGTRFDGSTYTYTDEPYIGAEHAEIWLDRARVACIEIEVDGEEMVILRDFNAG